jgi:hypothetical protein
MTARSPRSGEAAHCSPRRPPAFAPRLPQCTHADNPPHPQPPNPKPKQTPQTPSPRERFRQKLVALFVQLDGLKKYLEMNHTGFRKILKKHDKETTQVGLGWGRAWVGVALGLGWRLWG